LVSRIFAFNLMLRRLSNAVAELGTRCPCKSLKRRLCCRETMDRNGVDRRCDRNRKSIKPAKIRKDAIFVRAFKNVARMEPTGPARSGRPDDRLRVIRDCREASMPPRISLRSIRATILVMPALVVGIPVFTVRGEAKTWMVGTSPAMTVGRCSVACSLKPICYILARPNE